MPSISASICAALVSAIASVSSTPLVLLNTSTHSSLTLLAYNQKIQDHQHLKRQNSLLFVPYETRFDFGRFVGYRSKSTVCSGFDATRERFVFIEMDSILERGWAGTIISNGAVERTHGNSDACVVL